MLFDYLQRLDIGGGHLIFVNDCHKTLKPLFPAFAGNIIVDSLTQSARVGRGVETLSLMLKNSAVDKSGHREKLIAMSEMLCVGYGRIS